jgi:hypothetical protein
MPSVCVASEVGQAKERKEGRRRTDGRDEVDFGTELRLVAAGDVVHFAVALGLNVGRVANLNPHVAGGHEEDDELWNLCRVSVIEGRRKKGKRTRLDAAQMYLLPRMMDMYGHNLQIARAAATAVATLRATAPLSTGRTYSSEGSFARALRYEAMASALNPL